MIKVDYNNMTADMIGSKHGIDIKKSIQMDKQALDQAFDCVYSKKGQGDQTWMRLPFLRQKYIDEIVDYATPIKKTASDFVVIGIGGSALGVLSVTTALTHLRHNSLTRQERNAPKIHIGDNIDPTRFYGLMDTIDIENSYFNIVSKSGETTEVLAKFLCIYDMLIYKLGRVRARSRISVTTTRSKPSPLLAIAMKEGFRIFDIPDGVGGRFSVLSPVGLVAFAVLGLDINNLLHGARRMTNRCLSRNIWHNPALMTAYLQVCSMRAKKNISVLMPYADGLKYMTDFYCQLWAESLGKKDDKNKNVVHVGQTPVKAIGATDQHSQIQLYTQGPFDKVVTLIEVEQFERDKVIPSIESLEFCKELGGHSLGELLNIELKATQFALTKAKRPNFSIVLKKIDADSVGQLLAYFMMSTAYAGSLLDIDTYDQPGVQECKRATCALLQKQDCQDALRELTQLENKKSMEYII